MVFLYKIQIKLFCKVKLKDRNFKEYASNKYIGKTWGVQSVKKLIQDIEWTDCKGLLFTSLAVRLHTGLYQHDKVFIHTMSSLQPLLKSLMFPH